jgi:energy-coupling factor transporter ATP-binding protein EcfA2
MRVTALELEAFRCFVDTCRIELQPDSLNIVEAPNGSGKSTLAEALHMAFLVSHKSGGGDVKALVPWGKALSPRVAVEFETAGARWRVSKRWLQPAAALLERWSAGAWRKEAEGPAAEERLRQFAGMKPGFDKGAKGKDLFWTSVLWSTQGALPLQSVDDSVVETVRSSLTQQMEGGAAERLAALAAETAKRYWTPTGREARHSPVAALRSEHDAARARIAEARHRLNDLETLRAQLLEIEATRGPLTGRIAELAREAASVAAGLKQAAALRTALDREQNQIRLLRVEAVGLQDLQKRWRETAQRLDANRLQHESLLALAGPNAAGEAEALGKAVNHVEAVLRDAHAYLAARAEHSTHLRLLEMVLQVSGQLKDARSALDALNAPDARAWSALQKLWASVLNTRTRLDGALVHLEIHASQPLSLDVLAGEPAGRQSLAPGDSLRVSGSPVVEVEVAGAGRWRASGPSASAGQLRLELQELESSWARETAVYRTTGFDALQSRREAATLREAEIAELQAQLRTLLPDGDTPTLQARLTAGESACAAHERLHPEWVQTPPEIRHLELELAGLRSRREDALARIQAQQQARSLADQIRQDQTQLSAFEAEHQSMPALSAKSDALLLRLRSHELKAGEIEDQLKPFPATLEQRASDLQHEIENAQRQLSTSREAAQRLRGRIEEQAAQSPWQSLAHAEEQAGEIERSLAGLSDEAEAALLLRDTLDDCRSEMMSSISGAVAREASALITAIAGAAVGEIQLAAEFTPVTLTPAGHPEAVTLDQLSGGEFEQVHFATRLALAEHLCRLEPQLAIFDDVLMATDPARLARILALIEARRDHLQVLILTCHPERFASLTAANRIVLPGRR